MSEYAHDDGSPPRHDSDANLQNSLDESANNSIIGKVKSRVSSILPNRLSKWFSPSAKLQNDSLNGSIDSDNTILPNRRRRRLEVEEEPYEDDEDVNRCGQYRRSNHTYGRQEVNRDRDVDDDDENENDDDDDSQHSDEDYNETSVKQTRRDLNIEHQPPAKKSRLNIEVIDSPVVTRHQPLLSSTPALDGSYLHSTGSTTSSSRYTYQRLTHLNLYGNQIKKEQPFNFGQQKEPKSVAKSNTDIIDLLSNSSYENEDKVAEFENITADSRTGISSRKSLNIPSATALKGSEHVYATVSHLKRQPISSVKTDLSATSTAVTPVTRSSTNVLQIDRVGDNVNKQGGGINKGNVISDPNDNNYNGSIEDSSKKQKLINGTSINTAVIHETNEGILLDSASESGESAMDIMKTSSSNTKQRKTGLFNMSAGGSSNTRNSSRTSSFGNGLNFYSHLEGRKSLFSGSNHGANPLNNSTLSLTSLNRRQFNASIYGSTSALSDSRLLNTFSPFYKGKTTYGGAAAYNKYTSGAGASAIRITPTLIRPTSSLSSLSSSTISLANNVNSQIGDNSAISSTAKRILDLINDFATPLSEAKKMASNLKTNPSLNIPPQAKSRFNESDLNASRAMRLSQVRTPYSRSSVILQPSGNVSGVCKAGGILPPVKELQVPTMSQLLQLKKMQNTTENARKIVKNSLPNSEMPEYTLPDVEKSKINPTKSSTGKEQQKHTSKIRNKITKSTRSSAAPKDLQDEEPPPVVNLPNIEFPIMQSVPKIDIQINNSLVTDKTTSVYKTSNLATPTNDAIVLKTDSSTSIASNVSPINSLTQTAVSKPNNKNDQLRSIQSISEIKASNTFKFSNPLQVVGSVLPIQTATNNEIGKYKFSSPLVIASSSSNTFIKVHNTQPKQPQLKEGSCLDVLDKNFTIQSTTKSSVTEPSSSNKESPSLASGFGNQFKKSSNEWECNTCMIRNMSDTNKCVACETPRKQNSLISHQETISAIAPSKSSSFGQQFKKSSNEWECDTCMIRNSEKNLKCISCETPRKCPVVESSTALPPIKNSFGDAFKAKSDTWECQTCMISNKNSVNECIACQTKKPGCTSAVPPTQFKFGATGAVNTEPSLNVDPAFKMLAAQQKVSKWECDACMTRNDSNRTKCACCEQPKPGSSTAESTNSTSNKFQFGATAASKFSFGFGTGANKPKEEELRKELSSKSEETLKPPSTTLELGTSQSAPTLGFQFGIKSATSSNDSKKDEADGNKQIAGFKFGLSPTVGGIKVGEKSASVQSPPTDLVFDSTNLTTTINTKTTSIPTMSSVSAVDTTSVKFSLPSTTTSTSASNNDKPKGGALPAFGFGTSSTSPTTGGFSFSNKVETNTAITIEGKEQKTAESIAFKVPTTITANKTTGFIFGSAINSPAAVSTPLVSSTFNATTATTATTTCTTTATVKPIFSFGTNTSNTSAVNSQTTPSFSSFSFGSNSGNNAATSSPSANTLFAAVTSTSTITTTANTTTKLSHLSTSSTTNTTPASTNTFSLFGGGAGTLSNASATSVFGSSVNPPANNNLATVSSSTSIPTPANASQFGAFGSKPVSNVFGSFAGVGAKNSALVKPNGTKPTLPVFGNVASSSTSQSSPSNTSGFLFGSNTANAATISTASTTGTVTSTSTTWPKSSFAFGSNASATSRINPGPFNVSENKEIAATSGTIPGTFNVTENEKIAKPTLFGSFGSSNSNINNQQPNSSIFGGLASTINASSSASGTPASGPTNFSTNLFGTKSAPAATSIFGANSSGNAVTPASAFGSSTFGGAASSTSATPTFGSTAASGTTFGSFGSSTSNTATNTTEVKKPEAAFNFGTAPMTQSTSGGFNFGSSASTTKPAFNFGGTSASQPSFNFTGTTEGSTNTLFQFNAGSAPVSSNIFAPTPTLGAQTAQQAKRKIRAQIRRVTQR